MRVGGLVGAVAGKYFKHQSLAVPEAPRAASAVCDGPREADTQPRASADIGRAVITKSGS